MFYSVSDAMSYHDVAASQASTSLIQGDILKGERIQDMGRSLFSQAFAHIPECMVTDEKVYLTTNEGDQEKTLITLKSEPLIGNTLLATSGFFALNAASIRGQDHGQAIDYIIIIDRSIRVQKLWQEVQKIVNQFSLVDEALIEMKKMLNDKATEFWPASAYSNQAGEGTPNKSAADWINRLETETLVKFSWLSSQTSFERIKRIFAENHFVFKRLDFFDNQSISLLSQTIKQLGLTLDSIYLSNIQEYAEAVERVPSFHESLKELYQSMKDQTLVIDTIPRLEIQSSSEPLKQRVTHKIAITNLNTFFFTPIVQPSLNPFPYTIEITPELLQITLSFQNTPAKSPITTGLTQQLSMNDPKDKFIN